MRRFRFSLATLQRLREQSARAERRRMAKVVALVRLLEEEVHVIDQNIEVCQGDAHPTRAPSPLASALICGLVSSRAARQERLVTARRSLEEAHRRYEKRRRDLRVLEHFHETRFKEWLSAYEREQQKDLDEVAGMRFAMRRRAEHEG